MKLKGIIITILAVLFCAMPVLASHIDNYTKDDDIKAALEMLEKVNATEVFDNLAENSVKIVFYDLSQINYRYANHFAINSVDSFGNRFILINSQYKNASPEEIACIIAHESFHKLSSATYEEEYTATNKEAHYWNLLKDNNKEYKSSKLLSRLNNLSQLKVSSTSEQNLIDEKINHSSFYREQLASENQKEAKLPTFSMLAVR